MIQQFAYVYGVVGILLLSGKNIKCGYSFFTLSQDDDNQKTLITKNGFYILRIGFTMRSGLGLLAQASAQLTKPQKIFH